MVQVIADAVSKSVKTPQPLTILEDINLTINSGESLAIMGPSGSGKTTLLGLLAGLDVPTHGKISWDNQIISNMNEMERAKLRLGKVGFVFQNFQLLPYMTALDNVAIALELNGDRQSYAKAKDNLIQLGLEARLHHYPRQLSGGEQQRVALARAYATQPTLLFADEPTGNLDWKNAEQLIKRLKVLHETHRTTLIVATHDKRLADMCHQVVELKQGHLGKQIK